MQRKVTVVILTLLVWPLSAWAHVESGQPGGFLSGLWHPASGLDHVLAMVAVGLWGAQLGAPALWLLPVAFPMMMAFDGICVLAQHDERVGAIEVPCRRVDARECCGCLFIGPGTKQGHPVPQWLAELRPGIDVLAAIKQTLGPLIGSEKKADNGAGSCHQDKHRNHEDGDRDAEEKR